MFTKSEMEDIWNNKPVGYLKSITKKKLKRFKVTYIPVHEMVNYSESVEVFAASMDSARYSKETTELFNKLQKKYPKHYSFKVKCQEIR